MKKKRNYVSPLWLQLINDGDDTVYGEGSGQAGFDWGDSCITFDATADDYGRFYDAAGESVG